MSWTHNDLTAGTGAPFMETPLFTSWADGVHEHVAYYTRERITYDAHGPHLQERHLYELYHPLAGGSWAPNDLTVGTAAPHPNGLALTSWVDPRHDHLAYIGRDDGHVHELYHPLAGGAWKHNDLTTDNGAPPGTLDLVGLTSWVDPTHEHVVYKPDDGHLHELYRPLAGGAWEPNDLTAGTGAPPAQYRQDGLTSWVDPTHEHVVYGDDRGHLHELYHPLAGGAWAHNDLTAGTGSPPTWLTADLTSWVDPTHEHVVYGDRRGHLYELYHPLGGGAWAHNDLTDLLASWPVLLGSGLTSWVDTTHEHIVCAMTDMHVHELYRPLAGGTWKGNDLTALIGLPTTFVACLNSWVDSLHVHVAYATADGHLHELYADSREPTLAAVSVSPDIVIAGNNSTGAVTLDRPAVLGPVVVELVSNAPGFVTLPTAVTIPADESASARFPITTPPIQVPFSPVHAVIVATYADTSVYARLTVAPSVNAGILQSITLVPTSVRGGDQCHCVVTLEQPVSTDTLIGLAAVDEGIVFPVPGDGSSVVTLPQSIIVPAGQTSRGFLIATRRLAPTTMQQVATIIAAAVVTKYARLTVTV